MKLVGVVSGHQKFRRSAPVGIWRFAPVGIWRFAPFSLKAPPPYNSCLRPCYVYTYPSKMNAPPTSHSPAIRVNLKPRRGSWIQNKQFNLTSIVMIIQCNSQAMYH